ncbi:MAG: cysteine hydrolase [Gemmataceae bacterium]|nr:cysteine hydrolase [Gemmataceae bacterium]
MSCRATTLLLCLLMAFTGAAGWGQESATRIYDNRLSPIKDPGPLLADQPRYVEPIRTGPRFAAATLVDDAEAGLDVRAWRFSYNARGIIEVPNRLSAKKTAIIVVHPWGIDDGQGWKSPEPAGVAFQCTPFKNKLVLQHMADVINPLLKAHRGRVGLIGYSLPGTEDTIRKKLYRSIRHTPSDAEGQEGAKELAQKLKSFKYAGAPLPKEIKVSSDHPVRDYFKQFPGLDAGPRFNNAGFWDLPIPVAKPIDVAARDVVFYDAEGYSVVKDFLKKNGIRHVLLAGYNTDMCVISTTCGWKNFRQDFNVFLVGDATLATFPAHDTPKYATTAAVSFAALDLFITQGSWIKAADK